jgi:hypothetical protein
MHYYFQVGKVEKRRKIKTLLNHRKTMDHPGPMSLYHLPQSSPFPVQSWSTTQWNNKKMGKNTLFTNKMAKTASPFLSFIFTMFSYYFFTPLPPCHCVSPLLLFALSIYF